jgi:hypothetical protein
VHELRLVNYPVEIKAEFPVEDGVFIQGRGYVCAGCKTQIQFAKVGDVMVSVTAGNPKEGSQG